MFALVLVISPLGGEMATPALIFPSNGTPQKEEREHVSEEFQAEPHSVSKVFMESLC